MSKRSTAQRRQSNHALALTSKQQELRSEFCQAYGFRPEQISFESTSLEPIFDFDALSALAARLCNLPQVAVEFDAVDSKLSLVTCTGYAVLPNSNSRRVFGSAMVGEVLHDGEVIKTIPQAIAIARARALRTILRAVGFDAVAAHREFIKSGCVVQLQLPAKLPRDRERAEIHLLAQGLALITKTDRSGYEKAIETFFHGKTSSTQLTDSEHTQFLSILRAWSRAQAIANDRAA